MILKNKKNLYVGSFHSRLYKNLFRPNSENFRFLRVGCYCNISRLVACGYVLRCTSLRSRISRTLKYLPFSIIEPTEPFSSTHVKAVAPFNADTTKSAGPRLIIFFPAFRFFQIVQLSGKKMAASHRYRAYFPSQPGRTVTTADESVLGLTPYWGTYVKGPGSKGTSHDPLAMI